MQAVPKRNGQCETTDRGVAHRIGCWVTLRSALRITALRSAVLHWVFPLSHTWVGWSRQVFESFWAPLHLAWVFLCACLLAATCSTGKPAQEVFKHRALWWGGLVLTYVATTVGCWLVVAPQAGLSRVGPLVLLVLEYGVFAMLAARAMTGYARSNPAGDLSRPGILGGSPEQKGRGTSVLMAPAATLEKGTEPC